MGDVGHERPAGGDPGLRRIRQAADKIVYSSTLDEVSSARTTVERRFDPDAVRALKASSSGPRDRRTAARRARDPAGLVDEYQLFVVPTVVGGGTQFFPDEVRLDLDLADQRRFGNGTVHLRYRACGRRSWSRPLAPARGSRRTRSARGRCSARPPSWIAQLPHPINPALGGPWIATAFAVGTFARRRGPAATAGAASRSRPSSPTTRCGWSCIPERPAASP